MMENKITNITFILSKVTTEQFAIIEENFSDVEDLNMGINLRYGADDKQKLIVVFASFIFQANKQPFLKIEAGCHFQIEDISWNLMFNNESNSLTVPKGFMSHLAMLTVGTTRGILHAKTEGSSFNKYVIPTINVVELIKEDIIFTFIAQ